MTIGLNTFTTFAANHPQSSRVIADTGDALKDGSDATPSNSLSLALGDLAAWCGHPDVWVPVRPEVLVQENRDVVSAFKRALNNDHEIIGRSLGTAIGDAQPLSAERITSTVTLATSLASSKPLFEAREAMQLDTTGTTRLSDVALKRVMDDVRLPPADHGRIIRERVEATLDTLYPAIVRMDRSPDCSMLSTLGSYLSERLEDCVTRALGVTLGDPRGTELPPAPIVATMVSINSGDKTIDEVLPGLNARMNAEVNAFVQAVGIAFRRVEADLADISGTFFGGRALTGVEGVHVTDSDPHKGGSRVMIFDFGQGDKLVYKPRDVRIDQALTGSNLDGGKRSMMALAGADALTYRFLPKQVVPGVVDPSVAAHETGRYGYVEFLPNGAPADFVLSPSECARYYQLLGNGVGAMMFAGAVDLHHENIMSSRGLPCFSDLEFALKPDVLATVSRMIDPANTEDISASFDALMSAMAVKSAITRGNDPNKLSLPYKIGRDGAFSEVLTKTDVTESLVVLREGDQLTDNRGVLQSPQSLRSLFAADFAKGLVSAVTSLQSHHAEYAQWLDDAVGLQVRVHPINTDTQRSLLFDYFAKCHSADATERAQRPEVMHGDLLAYMQHVLPDLPGTLLPGHDDPARATDPRVVALMNTMLSAYAAHDVPYFSRRMDDDRLYFNGDTPLTWPGGGTAPAQTSFFTAPGTLMQQRGNLDQVLAAPLTGDGFARHAWQERLNDLQETASSWLAGTQLSDDTELGRDKVIETKTLNILRGLGAPPTQFAGCYQDELTR